jgi:hypothetical protein
VRSAFDPIASRAPWRRLPRVPVGKAVSKMQADSSREVHDVTICT